MAADDAQDGRPAYAIESVDKALRLLLQFAEHETLRLSDAADSLGIGRSTAHRLLAMLVFRGLAQQDPTTKLYKPGPKLVGLGLSVVRTLDVRVRARPYMEALAGELGETVNLVVREGTSVRFIDGVESPRALRVGNRVGLLLPAHTIAGGKVLLSALSTEELRALYPDEALSLRTDRSVATRSALEAQLAQVRERGYAVSVGESTAELSAVAVPLQDEFGQISAALAIAIPTSRATDEALDEIARAALKCARAFDGR